MGDAFVWLRTVLDQDLARVVVQGQDHGHGPGGLVHAQGHVQEAGLVLVGHEDLALSHDLGLGQGIHVHGQGQGHIQGHVQDQDPSHAPDQDRNPMMQRDQNLENMIAAQGLVLASCRQNLLANLKMTTKPEMSPAVAQGPDHALL